MGGEWRRDYQAKEVVRLPSVGEGRRRSVRNWRKIGKRLADRAGTNLNNGGEDGAWDEKGEREIVEGSRNEGEGRRETTKG